VTTATDTYLGWDELAHFDGCARPAWTVDLRTQADVFRDRQRDGKHECANEECFHSDRYTRTTVRIVCLSCQAACTVESEDGVRRGSSKTVTKGYGQPPRRVAGLLLWPGDPFLSWGRLATDEPWDFVVTRPGVTRVTTDDVAGVISQARGKRGALCWSAVAVRDDDGPYGLRPLRFAHAETSLRTVAAAAKWTAARLAETESAGGGGE
jgi:hypothetical protein